MTAVLSATGGRLSRAAREQQIAEGAAAMVVELGCLPLSLELLGQRLGISKALIYAYFPTQRALAETILRHRLAEIGAAIDAAFAADAAEDVALACAEAYFHQVAQHGPLLHILLGDPHIASDLAPDVRWLYGRIMRRLASGLRDRFGVPGRDCIAALHILAALPEEAGVLVFNATVEPTVGRALALDMTRGGLEGLSRLRAPGRGLSPSR
jgi:AcrR family transcriptional regulator